MLQAQLQGLKGVKNIIYDIIVYGARHEKHEENLEKCLMRIRKRSFTYDIIRTGVGFLATLSKFRTIFSEDGTKPHPKRFSGLLNVKVPKDVYDVCSLLRMVK